MLEKAYFKKKTILVKLFTQDSVSTLHAITMDSSGKAHVTVPVHVWWTLKTTQMEDRGMAVRVLPAEKAQGHKVET